MSSAPPKVSVCIPTFNYSRYLPEAIESVLIQDYSDLEVIIIDDASQDGSAEVVERYLRTDGRIRFHVNPSNIGMVRNWNRCFSEARGGYIKYVFGDNLLVSRGSLRRMAAVLDANPGVSLVSSARLLIDAESRVARTLAPFAGDCMEKGTDVINRCLYRQKNLIGEPSTVMFRRTQSTRGFNENYVQIVDLEMWFHLLEQGDFAYLSEPLSAFRIHPDQQTALNRRDVRRIEDMFHLLEDYVNKPYVDLGRIFNRYLEYRQEGRGVMRSG